MDYYVLTRWTVAWTSTSPTRLASRYALADAPQGIDLTRALVYLVPTRYITQFDDRHAHAYYDTPTPW